MKAKKTDTFEAGPDLTFKPFSMRELDLGELEFEDHEQIGAEE